MTIREFMESMRLPEDTLLQRKGKEYLLSGKEIQMDIDMFYK